VLAQSSKLSHNGAAARALWTMSLAHVDEKRKAAGSGDESKS
jgi:hypothetical protein